MTSKSWIATLLPLFIALAQTVKSFVTGEPLTDQEIELVKYLVVTFMASGAIGGYVSSRKGVVTK